MPPEPDNPLPDPLEAQQLLVESSLPLVFETYDQALDESVTDPVIVLVDCEDELGGEIARGWLGDEAVDDAIADDPDAETVVFARALPWQACRHELAEAFPYLAAVMAAPPAEGGVLVVGVTAGGASALTAPLDARD